MPKLPTSGEAGAPADSASSTSLAPRTHPSASTSLSASISQIAVTRAAHRPGDAYPRALYGIALIAVLLAVVSILPRFATSTWVFRDGRFYVNVAATLSESLTLDQHAFAASWYTGTWGWNRNLDAGWSNVALGANGEYWPKHPWIHPLLAAPMFYAFGLLGILAWNLSMFGWICAGLYRVARAYADPTPASAAVAVFVFGTALVESAYDFSVDVLMLALFSQGWAALIERRGIIAGLCIALCVMIKPTVLMLVPTLLLFIAAHAERQTLSGSLSSGASVLFAYAGINTWMYGRPWLSGYNRTLVTHDGQPVVADHMDAFSVPLAEGFARMWSGSYGLVYTFTALALAAPGWLWMVARRPLYSAGALLGVVASLVIFSKYAYEGHRFHWPALALMVPAIASTFTMAELGIQAASQQLASFRSERFVRRFPVEPSSAAVAGAAVFGLYATSFLVGAPWQQRLAPWLSNPLTEWMPDLLMILLVCAIVAYWASLLVYLGARVAPIAVVAIAVIGVLALPFVRDAVLASGSVSLSWACLTRAIVWAHQKRFSLALGALGAAVGAALLAGPIESGGHRGFAAMVVEAWTVGGDARWLLPLIIFGGLGLLMTLYRDRDLGIAIVGLIVPLAVVPFDRPAGAGPIFAICCAVCVDGLASYIALAARRLDARRTMLVVGVALAGLLVTGALERAVARTRPFRIATYRGVRDAVVHNGPVPCDFLAWEHLSWECSSFDRGLFGMAGLATSTGITVSGRRRELFLIPAAMRGPRSVEWSGVRAADTLTLRWAVPDGQRGGGVLSMEIDDVTHAELAIPEAPDGLVHLLEVSTHELRGQPAKLRFVYQAPLPSVVAVDLLWQ